jgi:hypothetical protein
MDATTFLARVQEYQRGGWRLALINVTTVMPAAPAPAPHGAPAAVDAAPVDAAPVDAAGVFEIAWGFAREGEFETWRETIEAGTAVPSVSEFFGAAFLYENEIRELFGINVTGIGVDLKGQLYKTATRVPFSHQAVKARLAQLAAAPVKQP